MLERPKPRGRSHPQDSHEAVEEEVTGVRKRTDIRSTLVIAARYRQIGKNVHTDALCTNLSTTGAFLGTNRPLRIRSVVIVEIDCEPFGIKRVLRCSAQVVWVRDTTSEENQPAGMGLRFLDLSTPSRRILDELLRRGDFGSAGAAGRSSHPPAKNQEEPQISATPPRDSKKPAEKSVESGAPKSDTAPQSANSFQPSARGDHVVTDVADESASSTQPLAHGEGFLESSANRATQVDSANNEDARWRAQRLAELVRESETFPDSRNAESRRHREAVVTKESPRRSPHDQSKPAIQVEHSSTDSQAREVESEAIAELVEARADIEDLPPLAKSAFKNRMLLAAIAAIGLAAWAEMSGHYVENALVDNADEPAKVAPTPAALVESAPPQEFVARDVVAPPVALAQPEAEAEVVEDAPQEVKASVRKPAAAPRHATPKPKAAQKRAASKVTPPDSQAGESPLVLARRALESGNPSEAREHAAAAVRQSPQQAEGYIILAGALDALHNRNEMKRVLQDCVDQATDQLVSACKSLAR